MNSNGKKIRNHISTIHQSTLTASSSMKPLPQIMPNAKEKLVNWCKK